MPENFTKNYNLAAAKGYALTLVYYNLPQHYQIFTDGSELEDGSINCAHTTYSPNHIPDNDKMIPLGRHRSIFSAEMYAIWEALAKLQDDTSVPVHNIPQHIAINTDFKYPCRHNENPQFHATKNNTTSDASYTNYTKKATPLPWHTIQAM